ncbi:hypothetical protein N1851_024415 [Merluccius polli]|uniref:Peptidase A2 domain-containing protein n=1 Tax=Merluccius polli TaxID=89951 RepID=A0AA47MFE7_MERPO|nr:hypothetical protein N1851_024415 [Merluccius polli]
MEQFKPPSPLILSGNIAENWRRWEQRFRLYVTASGALDKEETVKVAILLHTVGEEALEVYNTLTVTPAGANATMEEVLKAFKDYCSPQKNIVFERHQFWSHTMSTGISVDRFITELRQKSKNCEFGRNEEDMIRDKLVFSINDTRLKERLLRDNELTLRKAIDTCRSAELAKTQIQAMQTSPVVHDTSVDALRKATGQTRTASWNKSKTSSKKQGTTVCHKCGNKHEPRQCPAYGAVCHKCGKNNHFSKVCKADTENSSSYKTKTVHNIESEVDSLYIGMVHNDDKKVTRQTHTVWHETATIRGIAINFKLDTGADANVLPMSMYRQIPGPIQMRPTETVLIAFGGARVPADGVVCLKCRTTKSEAELDFHVTSQSNTPILGGDACEELQLVKRVEALSAKWPQPGKPLATKEELIERNVPLSIMDSLKETLKDLQKRKVITPVNEPTDWVNSLVATKKRNGALRVCLDPCDLNRAVKRQHYSIPTPEDVRSRLAGKSIFSILDEKDGYWQIKLDEPSSKLCTFNTPWGRFRFLRLPFGIKSASESFAASWEFKLTHSSPGFPSSNGMAERAIKTVKHALKKAMETGTDPHLVLLSLRNTPVTGLNMSPAQMLMGRVLRSTLPCSSAVLKQSTPQHIHDKVQDLQSRQKQRYDQRAKLLPALTSGDTVHMHTRRGWEPAVVIRQRDEPRSYTVQTPAGRMLRRNRRHLRKIHPSLFRDTGLDEHVDSEGQTFQTSETVDTPPQDPPPPVPPPHDPSPVNMDSRPTCYTRSGRAVRCPTRYRY